MSYLFRENIFNSIKLQSVFSKTFAKIRIKFFVFHGLQFVVVVVDGGCSLWCFSLLMVGADNGCH